MDPGVKELNMSSSIKEISNAIIKFEIEMQKLGLSIRINSLVCNSDTHSRIKCDPEILKFAEIEKVNKIYGTKLEVNDNEF